MNEEFTAVDQYLEALFVPDDEALRTALERSAQAGLPEIQVAANQGKFLHILALTRGARQILEIGTLGGYSTIWLARALPADGRLISFEYEPKHAEVARTNIEAAGLGDKVEVRVGRALDLLAELEAENAGPFDMVFIDADKPPYTEYLEAALHLSRPGTLIVADNVVRGGRVLDANSDDQSVQGVRRLNAALAADERVTATVIQLVGAKGHDGMALAVVK